MQLARKLGSYSAGQFRICHLYKLLLTVDVLNILNERRREREREILPAACWLMILEMENSPRSSIPWKLSSSSAPTERISASGTILGDSIVTPSVEVGNERFVINLTLFTHKANNCVGHTVQGNEGFMNFTTALFVELSKYADGSKSARQEQLVPNIILYPLTTGQLSNHKVHAYTMPTPN